MRLADLDAELHGTIEDGVLWFDCPFPVCQARGAHRIAVNISGAPFHERDPRPGVFSNHAGGWEWPGKNGKVKVWQATGAFPDTLSLQPSIDICECDDQGNKIRTICWHGHVTNGEAA